MSISRFLFVFLFVFVGVGSTVSAESSPQSPPFVSCANTAATTTVPQIECQALLALENSTNISTWGWKTSNNPCDWFGVSCTGGQITALNYSLNGITGTLPSQLGNLASLQILEIRRNSLTGSIPASIGNLSDLWLLNLERNQLSGSIPSSLGSMPNLADLSLNENQLTGPIPPQLGSATSLQALRLYRNQLTGGIPAELGMLTQLTTFRLHENNLSGTLPPELGNWVNMTYFQINDNPNLTGAIPDEYAAIGSVTFLYLYNTMLCVEDGSAAQAWVVSNSSTLPLCNPLALEMSHISTRSDTGQIWLAISVALLLTLASFLLVERYKPKGI